MRPFFRDKKYCVLSGLKLERALKLGEAKPKMVMPSGAVSDTAFAREDESQATSASQGAV